MSKNSQFVAAWEGIRCMKYTKLNPRRLTSSVRTSISGEPGLKVDAIS